MLITKLRSANNVETQQYRKASKALLVLIPLLGVTYILVMAGPSEGSAAKYYEHVRAMLLSTQVGLKVVDSRPAQSAGRVKKKLLQNP